MSAENLLLLSAEELPQTDEPKQGKRKKFKNILAAQLYRLMNHFKIEQAHIHKALQVPYGTLSAWVNSEVETQLLDSDIKAIANYFSVTIDFIAFATPMTDRDLELDDLMPDFDDDGYSNLNQEKAV